MSTQYQLSYYDDSGMWKGTWMVNYMCGLGWIQDTADSHMRLDNIYLNSKDQTDQAILLISLGLSQEDIQGVLNNG